jgi:hypothetical protein
MKIIRHETIGGDLGVDRCEVVVKPSEKEAVVLVAEKDALAVVPAIVNVIELFREECDFPASHKNASALCVSRQTSGFGEKPEV